LLYRKKKKMLDKLCLLFLLLLCNTCCVLCQTPSTSNGTVTPTTSTGSPIPPTDFCVPFLKDYDSQTLQLPENQLKQYNAQQNYDVNETYIPWDEDCIYSWKAFACANAFGNVCRSTCMDYVTYCWMRNGGNLDPNIFWRKEQYMKKLNYFCEINSVPDGPNCVSVYRYVEKH
jgi:hypothetical protein